MPGPQFIEPRPTRRFAVPVPVDEVDVVDRASRPLTYRPIHRHIGLVIT